MSELLKTLRIVKALSVADLSAESLCASEGMSIATLKRRIAEARSMGAQIETIQADKQWSYTLKNWSQVQRIVTRWMQLEEQRSFL